MRWLAKSTRVMLPRFERRLCRRNDFGGRFGRGAEPPSESNAFDGTPEELRGSDRIRRLYLGEQPEQARAR
jgi:hypothetical protein